MPPRLIVNLENLAITEIEHRYRISCGAFPNKTIVRITTNGRTIARLD
jgi:hypothetical protein